MKASVKKCLSMLLSVVLLLTMSVWGRTSAEASPNSRVLPLPEAYITAVGLEEGAQVVISLAAEPIALSSKTAENSRDLDGVEISPEDNVIFYPPEELVWTVGREGDCFTFSQNGEKLSMMESWSSLVLDGEHDTWRLETAASDGAYYLVNVARERYMEYYADAWSAYDYRENRESDYALRLYVKGDYTDRGLAYPVKGGNLYFDKETGTITACDEDILDGNIPQQIAGVPVTGIENAFHYCYALEEVRIPDSVESIDKRSFYACDKLKNIWVDPENKHFSDGGCGVLFSKDHSILIKYPCGRAGSYTLPDTVTEISQNAFYTCKKLTAAELPESVARIGDGAFASCTDLSGIWVAAENWHFSSDERGVLFDRNQTTLLQCPGKMGGEYVVPDSVTFMSPSCFEGCKLTAVTIPKGVTTIEANTFQDCGSLREVQLPDHLKSIGMQAFQGCHSLTELMVPESVNYIGDNAFGWCTDLKSVYFWGDAPELGKYVFDSYCPAPASVGDELRPSWSDYLPIEGLTLYYIEGRAGWTTPTWNGYPTAVWDDVNIPHTHSYEAAVTAPTCTEQGYTTYTCECGDSYVTDYVDALGHEYADGVCTRCGEEDPDYGAPQPVEFDDVSENAWYKDAVDYAVTNGLMNGTGNNQFEPESSMTRAMLVTVLWRYAVEPLEGENSFTDVPAGQWYTEAVAWAAHNGIVGGVGDNKFDPNGNITREQMAAILFRYANLLGIDTGARADLGTFPDSGEVSAYAADAIKWAVAEGLLNGSDGRLLPQGKATRAQVAAILMRFIENAIE